MNILPLAIKYQNTAVGVELSELYPVAAKKLLERVVPDGAEITGHDHVVIVRISAGVGKMRLERFVCCRSHGAAHVVGIRYAGINDPAGCEICDIRPGSAALQYHGTRACDRPLRGRCPLAAVFERKAVLPLGRAKVRACRGAHTFGKAAVERHRGEGHALAHGRACAVQAEVRHAGVFQRERRADALIEQIA